MFLLASTLKEKGKYVIDLTLGNPMVEPPKELNEAIIELLSSNKKGIHRYMHNAGFRETREVVAYDLRRKGIFPEISYQDVMLTVGAAGAMNLALKLVVNPGDEVILIAPYFPEYVFYIKSLQAIPVVVYPDSRFNLDLDEIERAISPRTKAIIINSPNNPSGKVYDANSLHGLAELLHYYSVKYNSIIYLISDEPYREILFRNIKYTSPASVYENSFISYSWSKTLSIPGERIGYLAINPKIRDRQTLQEGATFLQRVLGYVNAPAIMQLIIPKLINNLIPASVYYERYLILKEWFTKMGIGFVEPDGAFYIFAPVPKNFKSTDDFISYLLDKYNVIVVPGKAFGYSNHFRASFCGDINQLKRLKEL